jgi:deoxycytidine triphosphate deaminase
MVTLAQKRNEQLELLKSLYPPPEDDPHPDVTGVLLSDEIIFYANTERLLTPFYPQNLKPAAYELTISNEYFQSGEFLTQAGEGVVGQITIPPFDVVVLKTEEILRLPRYLIARWNIRVRHAYSGLLWVGGPQVDPGYIGNLFCPIYNLSDKPVSLPIGDAIAVIDFAKTTPFDKDKPKDVLLRYPFPPTRRILEDFGIDDLKSALFTKAGQKLEEVDESIRHLETRFVTFTQISFAIFAIVIAFLSLSSKAGAENLVLGASVWGSLTLGVAVAALLMALFSFLQWRVVRLVHERYGTMMANRASGAQRFIRRAWWLTAAVVVAVAVLGGYAVYLINEPFFQDVRQQRFLTRSDLDHSLSRTNDLSEQVNSTATDIEAVSGRVDTIDRRIAQMTQELRNLRIAVEQLVKRPSR